MGPTTGCSVVGGSTGGGVTGGMPCGSVGSPGPGGVDMSERLELRVAEFSRSAVLALVLLSLAACSTASEQATTPNTSTTSPASITEQAGPVCRFRDDRLTEISGLATSILHPDVLWTHNDSGDSARVFAVSLATCKVLAEVTLAGAEAVDTEAIAIGRDAAGQPTVWVADIGDNTGSRPSVQLRSFLEPKRLVDRSVTPKTLIVRYPDGPHDAEGLMVDPAPGGSAWIVTKKMAAKSGIYALPQGFANSDSVRLTKVGMAPAMSTDATFAPDRHSYVIRTYLDAEMYPAPPPSTDATALGVPLQQQGEAVTFSSDSRSLYLASEGTNSELIRFPLLR